MGSRTHYDNLQVSHAASAEVIRASYRALIQKYHPDRYARKSEGARISLILNAAYDVLSDPVSRRRYDEKLGLNDKQSPRSAPAPDVDTTPDVPPEPPPVSTPTRQGGTYAFVGAMFTAIVVGGMAALYRSTLDHHSIGTGSSAASVGLPEEPIDRSKLTAQYSRFMLEPCPLIRAQHAELYGRATTQLAPYFSADDKLRYAALNRAEQEVDAEGEVACSSTKPRKSKLSATQDSRVSGH